MVGWRPLTVENQQIPPDAQTELESVAEPETVAEPEPVADPEPITERPRPVEAPAESSVQDAAVRPRRMAGWQPLSVANTAVKASPPEPAPAEPVVEEPVLEEPIAETPRTSAGPIQDPEVPRRRMAGWTPLTVAH